MAIYANTKKRDVSLAWNAAFRRVGALGDTSSSMPIAECPNRRLRPKLDFSPKLHGRTDCEIASISAKALEIREIKHEVFAWAVLRRSRAHAKFQRFGCDFTRETASRIIHVNDQLLST